MYIAKMLLKMSWEVMVPPTGSENGWQQDSKLILSLFKCCVDTGGAGREGLELGDEGLWGHQDHPSDPQAGAQGSAGSLNSAPRGRRECFCASAKIRDDVRLEGASFWFS